ncbi:hypothetical protein FRB90_008960 [Tulasnella sp. 427]|nr:hypothetical protein FRB90_008960 [Tulasnella sp. 427]
MDRNQPVSATPIRSGTLRSNKDVTKQRRQVCEHMAGEMIRCTKWERGFNHYLPDFVKPDDEAAAIDALRKEMLLEGDDSNLRFCEYPDDGSKLPDLEKDFFQPLVDICDGLRRLPALSRRQVSCTLEHKSYNYNSAETPGANFKVDGYLKLDQSAMPVPQADVAVADVAVPAEYKRQRTEDTVQENREQLMGTINFCMNDDPRRMYINAVYHSMMTVWYFSRSHSAKSPEFDFTRDPRRYIQIMLALLFATEKELGYDPTIKRQLDTTVPGVSRLCFIYAVGAKAGKVRFFKTLEAIFEHRSLCVTGRATRVWKVVEVGSFDDLQGFGPEMVLKDVWLDKGAKTEGENQAAIFAQLRKIAAQLINSGNDSASAQDTPGILAFKSLDQESKLLLEICLVNKIWDKYFLTVVHDWQGHTSKDTAPEHEVDNRLFEPSTGNLTPATVSRPDLSRSTIFNPIEASSDRPTLVIPSRRYLPKRQYRVVFRDVCEALHDVRRLRDVGTALQDCVFGLQLMFVAGWVHRDISSGNLYARRVGNEVQGILADLEYAKLFEPEPPNSSSDPKTGTAYFMAVEIHKQIPFARTRSKPSVPPSNVVPVKHEAQPTTHVCGVIHNFQHDLESIFWVLLWTMLRRVPLRLPEDSGRHETFMMAAKAEISTIFQDNTAPSIQRENLIVSPIALASLMSRLFHPMLGGITGFLQDFRAILDWNYHNGTSHQDLAKYSEIYPFARTAARACIQADLEGNVPKLRPCRQIPDSTTGQPATKTSLPGPGKRKGGADGGDRNDPDYVPKVARMDSGPNSEFGFRLRSSAS